jgi:hypothetical protein
MVSSPSNRTAYSGNKPFPSWVKLGRMGFRFLLFLLLACKRQLSLLATLVTSVEAILSSELED